MNQGQLIEKTYLENKEKLEHYSFYLTKDRIEAEDLLQTSLYKAFKNSQKFKTNDNVLGWLHVIIKNNFINNYRKEKIKKEYLTNLTSDSYRVVSYNTAEESINYRVIQNQIDNLNPKYREIFKLFCDGYKYKEISEITGVTLNTVKTIIRQSRLKLMDSLGQYYPEQVTYIIK